MNSRCRHEIDWGSDIPDARLLTERTRWRMGLEDAIDRSADIYQAIHDAAKLKNLEHVPGTPEAGNSRLPKMPRKSVPARGTLLHTDCCNYGRELSTSIAPASPTTPPRKLTSAEIIRAIHSPTSAKDDRAARTSSPSSSHSSRRPHRRGDSGSSGDIA